MRVFLIALSVAALATAVARADPAPPAQQAVDTLNKIWGTHPGARANHAKGRVLEGVFTPAAEASGLSNALLFKGPPVPVTIRFSDSGGLPTMPDGDGPANPHGLSVRFHQSDGANVDMVTNSLHFFPVANGEDFVALLGAIAASPPGTAKPTPLDDFMRAHPAAPKALGTAATPVSFAQEHYFGVDAFILVDGKGRRQPVRFEFSPAAPEAHLKPEDARKQPPNFLMQEIEARVAKAPVVFTLSAQLADPSDPVNDATRPWPAERRHVTLGTLKIDKVVADNAGAEKALLFLPTNLTDGIEASDDPLIGFRTQAYGVSFSRRQ